MIIGFANNGVNFGRNGILFMNNTVIRQSGASGIYINGSPSLPSVGTIEHVLFEGNQFGLVVDNATVSARNSNASANLEIGFYAQAFSVGGTATLSADNCLANYNNNGFQAGNFGTARLTVSNSVASGNRVNGIVAIGNGIVRASDNIVVGNATGLRQIAPAALESRGNNTVRGNIADVVGIITTFPPM